MFFQSIQPTVRKGEALMDEEDDFSSDDQSDDSDHRHGIWMRRRRLDGALNRVPVGFYSKVWMILENCRGILVRGRTLDTFLTQGVSKITDQAKSLIFAKAKSIGFFFLDD